MEVRAELKYTKSHEWVKEEGGVWTIGLTDYAQSALGESRICEIFRKPETV